MSKCVITGNGLCPHKEISGKLCTYCKIPDKGLEFKNAHRNRYYGLRVGDIVEEKAFGQVRKGEVIMLGMADNNSCLVNVEKTPVYSQATKCVCEWCTIIEKVEDRILKGEYNES